MIKTFTLEQLAISPLNVRFNEEDCAAVEALSASIVAEGLLQPLVLHPVPEGADWAEIDLPSSSGAVGRTKASFGVLAGGRRYRAIRRAIEAGELPADFEIAACVRDLPRGAIILMSLSENLLRRNLREYEVHRAIAAAHAEGLTIEEIARQTGQRPDFIAQQLRLGELHPDVFAAYVAGEISADQAKAFAATDDRALQRDTFRHFAGEPSFVRTPAAIRAFIKVGDAELKKLLLFVGEAIYRGQGGRFELDLFADGPDFDRGRIVDETLLRELANEKLATLRTKIRSEIGERELRFQPRPPQFAGNDDTALELTHQTDWRKTRIGRHPVECFVATIQIDREGRWEPRVFWASRKLKGEHTRKPAAPPPSSGLVPTGGEALASQSIGYDVEARRIVRDEHGLSSDGINIMRSLRRDMLRGLLVEAGKNEFAEQADLARDYLTWSQLRGEIKTDREHVTGLRGLQPQGWTEAEREPAELLRGQREEQSGWREWILEWEAVSFHPAFAIDNDPAKALEAYLDAGRGFKRRAEALLAGLALARSANTPGYKIEAHDVLARRLGATPERLRQLWEPTPAFTVLFGKMHRLEMAQPFVEPAYFKDWHKLKDKPLSGATAAALQGLQQGDNGARAKAWIHPLLTFEGLDQDPVPDEDEERRQDPGPDDESVPDEAMTAQVPA